MAPSACETMTVGIVVPGGAVPPGAVAGPATLFTITTAAAPAACALAVLSAKLQLPRSTSAIAPAGNPTNGEQPSFGAAVPSFASAYWPAMPAAGAAGP